MRSAPYRVYQFLAALGAFLPGWAGGVGRQLSRPEQLLVETILATPAQRQLFTRMPPNDQRHAVAVARTIWQAGYRHAGLLQAALLHDMAKSLGQPLIHRVLIVLLEKFWPAVLRRWSSTPLQISALPAWRRPFVVHARHPVIGATWAQRANCEPLAVELILRHQDQPEDGSGDFARLLAVLRWADNLN